MVLKMKEALIFYLFLFIYFYSFDPATWGHSPKDVEHVKIHVT